MNKILLIVLFLFLVIISISSSSAAVSDVNTTQPSSTVKLVFIHHSCGGNWLADGDGNLGDALNDNHYYVTETNYGWNAQPGDGQGDHTDTSDWPSWFNDDKMPYIYSNDENSAYSNHIANPGGENEIIMFKSCYPLSEVGDSISDEKSVYNSLLPYFAAHQNKLFILITPPGETHVDSYLKTRELCNWLVDIDNGWLKDYTGKNVFVFDFYCVLSETGSHHRVSGGEVEYVYSSSYDGNSPYHNGDDHPNAVGNQKATNEFLPLLNNAYNQWKNSQGPNIISSDPTNKAVNVARDKTITITYNQDIQMGTGFIELKNSAGGAVPITTSITGSVLTIDPDVLLEPGTKFILYLHTGCVTDLSGNPTSSASSSFSTPTTILSINPTNNAVNVSSHKIIEVTYSSDIQAGNMFIELKNRAGTPMNITTTISGNILTITPQNSLAENRYCLILHTGCVADTLGNPAKNNSSYFIVGSSPYISSSSPGNWATGVARNKVITITFNEDIKKSGNCFVELKSASGSKKAITTTVSGKKLTIKHSTKLSSYTKYTVYLHTGCITDLAGNPVKSVSRTFTTGGS